ncbi:MAG: lytic transglycosylase domain-containing protein [Oscillospiraceae bacterium]|nr:lytic transglycosylase domain-containing protein [Oscillospiraceae bacterium]
MTKSIPANKKSIKKIIIAFVMLSLATICTAFALIFLYKTAYPLKYVEYIEEFSEKYNVDKYLVYAVIRTESSFNAAAVSHQNAFGLMQITGETFDWAKQRMRDHRDISRDDLYNEKYNIEYGTFLLSVLTTEFESSDAALAAYHSGRRQVNIWLEDKKYSPDGIHLEISSMPQNTRNYILRVNNSYRVYKKLYA